MNKGILIGSIIFISAGLYLILTMDANYEKFLTGIAIVFIACVVLIIAKVKGN